MQQQQYKELNRIRRRSAILVALILHLILGIVYVFTPHKEVVKDREHIAVEWVKAPPRSELKKLKTKPPLKMRVHRPDEELAREATHKLVESPRHRITEVVRLSERIIHENLEVSAAPLTEKMPEMMTEANLRESERSNIGRPVSLRADGRGKVTERTRLRGRRTGLSLVDSLGDSEEGLIDGGGNPGIADKLDIIKFLDEFEGAREVVFCLDVSSSMQAAGLKKLELAIEAIKDALFSLTDDDHFNIITFSASATLGKRKLAPATLKNIETASTYLDRFTPLQIANNYGTNLLETVEKALEINPSIIVLVTDGFPAAGRNKEELLFSIDMKLQHDLTQKNVPVMQRAFENSGITLSPNTTISIEQSESQWLISDENQMYRIQAGPVRLKVYKVHRPDYIETNTEKILETIRAKNVNRASIYVVGLEIDPRRLNTDNLLVHLTEQNNGRLKVVDYNQLVKYAREDEGP